MEPLLETIDLDMDESNELLFKVKVEGTDPAPARVRLVCEGGDVAYMFNGKPSGQDGIVQFNLPVMKDKLREGLYQGRVEVLIENRYFAPVQFQINFKKAVKVVAEALTTQPRKQVPEIRVEAQPIIVKKQAGAAPSPADLKPEKQAPPPARVNARMTLRERYHARLSDDISKGDEEVIRELARAFIKSRKR